jgi:hypothetical protein
VANFTDNCVVKGSIFGCNNLNGSPQKAVTVHVYKTARADNNGNVIATKPDKESGVYELKAVYGGGNLAPFIPDLKATSDTVQARVIIDGCDKTSIRTVYGGGNAASAPATNVTINSTYEIEEVFGGGNGLDPYVLYEENYQNPGANVGYKNYTKFKWNGEKNLYEVVVNVDADTKEERLGSDYVYGSGEANVNIYGGRIHRVFGGSNTLGNVRVTAVTVLDNEDPCDLNIDEAYGGGKSAPMDAEAKLMMACIPGLKAAYGGAQDADIQDDVVLTITNGTFDRVFGGNNVNGNIHGTITVNVEETGCKPVIIGQLYGGGNLAPYKAPTAKQGPTLNVKSFTSIGEVYGGGYGQTAEVEGNPTVNIAVANGDWYNKDESVVVENAKTTGDYPIPSHVKGKIGAINNVFGGGNAAAVKGNTYVNIGTTEYEKVVSVIAGKTDVSRYYTRSGEGTEDSPYEYIAVSLAKQGVTYYQRVQGSEGETYEKVTSVTAGNTDVSNYYTRSGEGTEDSPYVFTPVSIAASNTDYYMHVLGVDIRGNVYGGGNNAEVTGNTNVVIGREATTTTNSSSSTTNP